MFTIGLAAIPKRLGDPGCLGAPKVTITTRDAGERVFIDMLALTNWKGPSLPASSEVVAKTFSRAGAGFAERRPLRHSARLTQAEKSVPPFASAANRCSPEPSVRFPYSKTPDGVAVSSVARRTEAHRLFF